MNAVGKIGEFIIEYQYPIEIALLSVLAIIVIYALIKALFRTRKDKNVLSQINSTVSDINNTVSSINDKQTVRAESESGIVKNNISVSRELPSVKVSYVLSDDERDRQTTVSIDHEYMQDDDHKADSDASAAKAAAKPEPLDAEGVSVYEELKKHDAEDSIEELIKTINREEKASAECADKNEKPFIPKVFASRDCAVDKYGNVYTEEQLSEQIK